jgi:hypothetical protein
MKSSFARKRAFGLPLAVLATAAFLVLGAGTAAGDEGDDPKDESEAAEAVPLSGAVEFRDLDLGHFITECPQAGRNLDQKPKPLDRRQRDEIEQSIARRSDDLRTNQDYSCFPQDETSIAVNPKNNDSLVAGANDYRLGTGSSGFYASTDAGKNWYDGIIPFPSAPANVSRGEGIIPSGGDPVTAFDRAGIAYYAQIGFYRGDDTNGVFVSRSTNGGFTWSRACVPNPFPAGTVCGATGDPRQSGDGVVTFNPDNDTLPNTSVPFNDKEWLTTGPRPGGVAPQCFTPTHEPTACEEPRAIGVDRLYVTWSKFMPAAAGGGSPIFFSYSDDQGRSWSPEMRISGNAPFCVGSPGSECRFNQASVPTTNPATGGIYVAFINGNTIDEDQYLAVRSTDGGNTWEGPFFITPIYDANYPRAAQTPTGPFGTRPDCLARGQQALRQVLTNSCFRVNSYGNIVVDRRGDDFADDLYVVISDNRNGNPASSNVDVFLFKSTDGGETWLGPTRVNNDRSVPAPDRDCARNEPFEFYPRLALLPECGGVGDFGNDQWFPWVDVSTRGDLNVVFHDRRLDRESERHEWPSSRERAGNYLAWFFGGVCTVTRTATIPPDATTIPNAARGCLAREAQIIRQPTGPVDPGPNPVPGQNQTELPFQNFQVSDVPFNLDYSFRAGIFMGDYNNVAIADGQRQAWGYWTDARNGRSSGGPAGVPGGEPSQPGRNPLCEQSDVFLEKWNAQRGGREPTLDPDDNLFLVSPCPDVVTEEKSSEG